MLSLKSKSKLEKLEGKTFLYRATAYRITGYVEANDRIIVSTDVKPLNLEAAKIDAFIDELLPCDVAALPEKNTGVDPTVLGQLTNSLMKSLLEVDTAKTEEEIRLAARRVSNKVALSRAVTDIAKTHILAAKFAS